MRTSPRAFTLIELLAVLAIIVTLASLSVAGLNRVLTSGKATRCLNNMRQLGMAAHAYAAENQGTLPQSSHQGPARAWTTVLKKLVPKTLFVSPLDTTKRTSSYAINDFVTEYPAGERSLNFSRMQNIPSPSQTFYMAVLNSAVRNSDHFHFAEEGYTSSSFEAEIWVNLIEKSASNYLFVDGHVERLKWADVQAKLSQEGSRFVRPDGTNSQ